MLEQLLLLQSLEAVSGSILVRGTLRGTRDQFDQRQSGHICIHRCIVRNFHAVAVDSLRLFFLGILHIYPVQTSIAPDKLQLLLILLILIPFVFLLHGTSPSSRTAPYPNFIRPLSHKQIPPTLRPTLRAASPSRCPSPIITIRTRIMPPHPTLLIITPHAMRDYLSAPLAVSNSYDRIVSASG
jgi:hypothetical protein